MSSVAWADWNFTALEQDVVARLKDLTQTGPDAWARIVGTRGDIADVREDQQVVPGVYVIYGNFIVKASNDNSAELEHPLRVVLALRQAAASRDSGAVNVQAGKYLAQIMKGLHGYIAAGCTTSLIPKTPPPIYHKGPFSYYPLQFSATTIYSTRRGPAIGDLQLDRRYP